MYHKYSQIVKMVQKLCLRNTEKFMLLSNACDFDFDLMTLEFKLNLPIIMTYLHTINVVNKSNDSKAMA